MSKLPLVVLYLVRMLCLLPAAAWEQLFLAGKIKRTAVSLPPVFILGHQRSGTTLLHKLLARDPQFAGLDTYDVLFPYSSRQQKRWLQPLLQRILRGLRVANPHFNRYALQLSDPLEEDFFLLSAASPHSAYWGDAFPQRREYFSDTTIFFPSDRWRDAYVYVLKKTTRRHDGQRFLSKSPPNTGRVRTLLQQFPHARFIYLYRNPYQVFYSTFQQWKRTIARHYLLQRTSDAAIEDTVFRYYLRLLDAYEADKALIPSGQLVELRFEDLQAAPLQQLQAVYASLGLTWSAEAERRMIKQLAAEQGYQPYSYAYDADLEEKIRAQWGKYIERWAYSPPPAPRERS